MRTASPVVSVCREPDVVPESGIVSEPPRPRRSMSMGRPVEVASICSMIVSLPCPMSEAAV